MFKHLVRIFCLLAIAVSVMAQESTEAWLAAEDPLPVDVDIEEHLVAIVTAEKAAQFNTLRLALLSKPADTSLLIATAIEAGYLHDDVLNQCRRPLEGFQVASLIMTLLEDNAEIENVFRTCLPALPVSEVTDLMARILQRSDPTQIEYTIQMALTVLTSEGLDSSTILVESLLAGGLIESDDADCTGDCLRPLAEDLVENLAAGFDNTVDTGPVDEPALSDS